MGDDFDELADDPSEAAGPHDDRAAAIRFLGKCVVAAAALFGAGVTLAAIVLGVAIAYHARSGRYEHVPLDAGDDPYWSFDTFSGNLEGG